MSRGRGHETSAQEEDGVPTGLLSGWDTNVSLGPCPVPRTRADSSRTPRTTPVSAPGRPRVLLPTDLDVPLRRCEVGDRDSVTPVSPKLPNAHTQIINPPWSEPPRASRHVPRPGQWWQVRGAAPGVSADTHRHSPVTQRVQGLAMRPPPRLHAAVTGCSRAVTHIHTPLPARHGDRWAPHTRTLDAWGVRAPWVGDGRWVTAPCPPRGGPRVGARPGPPALLTKLQLLLLLFLLDGWQEVGPPLVTGRHHGAPLHLVGQGRGAVSPAGEGPGHSRRPSPGPRSVCRSQGSAGPGDKGGS